MTFDVDEIAQIAEAVRPIIREELARAGQSEFMTLADIVRDIGRSGRWLNDHPWALPNYGRPDLDGRPKQWRRENWEAWRSDLKGHERRWNAMGTRERMKVLGISP